MELRHFSEETFLGRNDRICNTWLGAGFTPNLHLFALLAAGQGVAVMPKFARALPHPQVVFMPLHLN